MTPPTEPPRNGSSGEADRRSADLGDDQTVADAEQSGSDADQTAADAEQTAADVDRENADRDRLLSDADQRSSDRDQAIADREAGDAGTPEPAGRQTRDTSRIEREATAAARAQTATIREESALHRFAATELRDDVARARDLASEARDLAARARDRLAVQDERGPAVAARDRAADDRRRAGEDRQHAAADRALARVDRDQRAVLSEAHVDGLTGSYRRVMGRIALQEEIDRAHRSDCRLVLACVDVDALAAHNDREGHAAGDELLIDVVASIRSELRSYDPVVRFGDDEFVCALSDADLDDARNRFDGIQAALEQGRQHGSISVGFAQLQPDDTLEDLIARGDAALYEAKQRK